MLKRKQLLKVNNTKISNKSKALSNIKKIFKMQPQLIPEHINIQNLRYASLNLSRKKYSDWLKAIN